MKKLQTLLAAAMLSAALGASAQSAASSGYGTVVRAVGIASYSLGDNVWHPLQAGKYLPAGSTVRTGHNGIVDIVLGKDVPMPQAAWQPDRISFAPDAPVRGMINYRPSTEQNVVRVMPDTMLGIDKLTVTDTGADTVNDTELNLKDGKIFASVKKDSAASEYFIKLPNGIAGIRGTLCYFSVAGGALQEAGCSESHNGGMVVSTVDANGGTKTCLVPPGQSCDGNLDLAPLPADLAQALQDVFTALKTIYFHVVDFSFDHTQCYTSPTQGGGSGHHGGHGNNGGGGDQGGGGFP